MKEKEIEIFENLQAKYPEESKHFFFFFLKGNVFPEELIKSVPEDIFHTDFFNDFSKICKEELDGDFWYFWEDKIYSFDYVLSIISPSRYGSDDHCIVFYGRDYFFSKDNPLFKIASEIANTLTFSYAF